MEENKVLFSVTKNVDGSAAMLRTETADEVFAVALAMYQVITECPKLALILETLFTVDDEEFRKMLQEHTINMPDFNEILKNTK